VPGRTEERIPLAGLGAYARLMPYAVKKRFGITTTLVATVPFEFNTQRLAFRNWRDDHRLAFAAMNSDPEVMRYFPAIQNEEQSNATVDAWRDHFHQRGWGNWAVELLGTGEFIGFIGLNVPRRQLPFSPCIEIGWRLKRAAWGHGFATEGAKECLRQGFTRLGLDEIVSFTARVNTPSIAVMRRIGLIDANTEFEHPGVPEGHPLRPHCLYKASRPEWLLTGA
jgi:RimJ/RimL family protein N-acetyltransferase